MQNNKNKTNKCDSIETEDCFYFGHLIFNKS